MEILFDLNNFLEGIANFYFEHVGSRKLLKDGRKNAAQLSGGTNMQTMIDEIKKNFTASIFGFGSK